MASKCLDICRNKEACSSDSRDALLLLMIDSHCEDYVDVFKNCCGGKSIVVSKFNLSVLFKYDLNDKIKLLFIIKRVKKITAQILKKLMIM